MEDDTEEDNDLDDPKEDIEMSNVTIDDHKGTDINDYFKLDQ